jgi:hypothetical protein
MKTYYPLFMKKISYIFLFSIISLSVFAIGDKDKNDSKSNLKSAEKALELGDKYQAIDLFEKVLSKESNV